MAIRVLRDHGVREVCISTRSDPDGISHLLTTSENLPGSHSLPHIRRSKGCRSERDSEGLPQSKNYYGSD